MKIFLSCDYEYINKCENTFTEAIFTKFAINEKTQVINEKNNVWIKGHTNMSKHIVQCHAEREISFS